MAKVATERTTSNGKAHAPPKRECTPSSTAAAPTTRQREAVRAKVLAAIEAAESRRPSDWTPPSPEQFAEARARVQRAFMSRVAGRAPSQTAPTEWVPPDYDPKRLELEAAWRAMVLARRDDVAEIRAHLDSLVPFLNDDSDAGAEARSAVTKIAAVVRRTRANIASAGQEEVVVRYLDVATGLTGKGPAMRGYAGKAGPIKEDAERVVWRICKDLGLSEPPDMKAAVAAVVDAIRPRAGTGNRESQQRVVAFKKVFPALGLATPTRGIQQIRRGITAKLDHWNTPGGRNAKV